jgi:hypothetical protein
VTPGFTFAFAWNVATLAAVILRRTSTPPNIFTAPSIPSCVLSNRANPGAGATSTKSNSTSPDLWSAAALLPLFPSYSLRRGSTLLNPMSALSLDLVTLPRSYAFLFNPNRWHIFVIALAFPRHPEAVPFGAEGSQPSRLGRELAKRGICCFPVLPPPLCNLPSLPDSNLV